MRIGLGAKQVAGVVTIVGLAVVSLSALHVAALVHLSLQESQARAELLSNAIFHRARALVAQGTQPLAPLSDDAGLRSLLESSVFSPDVTYAAIVGADGVSVADSDHAREGTRVQPAAELAPLLALDRFRQALAIYLSAGQTLEVRHPLLLDGVEIGTIRIGVSTLLVRRELAAALRPAAYTTAAALLVATIVSLLFARLLLRPIHVIRSGLSRLGKGEVGVTVDLPRGDEFGELGASFNTLSARLAASRSEAASERARPGSVVAQLEDAVGFFSADGALLFANPAMRRLVGSAPAGQPIAELLDFGHPFRTLVEKALGIGASLPAREVRVTPHGAEDASAETDVLAIAHAVRNVAKGLVGVMLVARDLQYLGRVQSTVNYSRKLAALGRLSGGVAHEVKNPLNAMTIHLELLKQKLTGASPSGRRGARMDAGDGEPRPANVEGALEHARVIAGEIRRLDEVLQGFIKFTRSEELRLQPVPVGELVREVVATVAPGAEQSGINVKVEGLDAAPDVNGDPGMLRQALMNLTLNACQAMPSGGTLRLFARPSRGRRVEIGVEDSGHGIEPEHLGKIFNLYFTTKEQGSGIGLSMVYRTVQLHDGEVEVESTLGRGTTFRLLLPQA